MKLGISVVALALIGVAGSQHAKSRANDSFNGFELVDKNGNLIKKPAGYRDHYQSLGVYTVIDPKQGEEMHYTWASPGTAEYYRKTGDGNPSK